MPRSRGSGSTSPSSRTGRARSSSPRIRSWRPRVRDIVGLYVDPPEKAVVLCVDEKSQPALDRTAPILPLRPGLPESRTHDYIRHGTTTLFAALEVATGKGVEASMPRHRHQEFLRFLPHREGLPAPAAAHRLRQVRLPQAPQGQRVAGAHPAHPAALHPDVGIVAEHGRDLLRHPDPTSHPPRHLHLGDRPGGKRSPPTSRTGTHAASPSPGPRTPKPSLPKPHHHRTHKTRQSHDTRRGLSVGTRRSRVSRTCTCEQTAERASATTAPFRRVRTPTLCRPRWRGLWGTVSRGFRVLRVGEAAGAPAADRGPSRRRCAVPPGRRCGCSSPSRHLTMRVCQSSVRENVEPVLQEPADCGLSRE